MRHPLHQIHLLHLLRNRSQADSCMEWILQSCRLLLRLPDSTSTYHHYQTLSLLAGLRHPYIPSRLPAFHLQMQMPLQKKLLSGWLPERYTSHHPWCHLRWSDSIFHQCTGIYSWRLFLCYQSRTTQAHHNPLPAYSHLAQVSAILYMPSLLSRFRSSTDLPWYSPAIRWASGLPHWTCSTCRWYLLLSSHPLRCMPFLQNQNNSTEPLAYHRCSGCLPAHPHHWGSLSIHW